MCSAERRMISACLRLRRRSSSAVVPSATRRSAGSRTGGCADRGRQSRRRPSGISIAARSASSWRFGSADVDDDAGHSQRLSAWGPARRPCRCLGARCNHRMSAVARNAMIDCADLPLQVLLDDASRPSSHRRDESGLETRRSRHESRILRTRADCTYSGLKYATSAMRSQSQRPIPAAMIASDRRSWLASSATSALVAIADIDDVSDHTDVAPVVVQRTPRRQHPDLGARLAARPELVLHDGALANLLERCLHHALRAFIWNKIGQSTAQHLV